MKLLSRLAIASSLVAACGGGQKSSSSGGTGHVSIRSAARAATASGTTPVCAHFTLQPFSPSSDGSPNNAGAPIEINSSQASGNTDSIVGCIDGPNDTAGYNWGFIVTADTFSECGATPGTLGAPLTNVFPAVATFIVPVHCSAGLDVTVPVEAQVSIAVAGQGGYVDISTQVNATTVQTGCKQADIGFQTDHQLHFGESTIAADGSTATGLVALDTGSPTQFGGTVNGAAGAVDTFYTGLIAPHSVSSIYQTFVNSCPSGQQYAGARHAQCVSDNSGSPSGTVAGLADAFIDLPGTGFASASVVAGGLQIYSSLGTATMTAGSSFAPAFNPLSTTTIAASDPSINLFTITGVYVDQGHQLQFLVAGTAGDGTPVFASLTHGSGAWTVSSFKPVDGQIISCNGLYSAPASCAAVKDCTNGEGARTGIIVWQPPLATWWLYAFYSGPPAAQSSVILSTAGEPNLALDTSVGFPTYGIRFATKKGWGSPYNISVASAPANLTCVIQQGSGVIFSANAYSTISCGPKSWKEVAAGMVHGVGIATDGTLWTWGNNYYDTLGLATNQSSFSPAQIGTDNTWKHIATGPEFTVGIKNDGSLWAWGDNFSSGLGNGTANKLIVPTKIGTDMDWAQVGTSWNTIVALKANGTLWRWGYDYATHGNVLAPAQIGTATDWAKVSSGVWDVVLIKSGNTAWAWGQNFATAQPQQIGTANDWASGAAGDSNLFLIKQSGALWAMGNNASGQLGDGTTVDKAALTLIPGFSDWVQVSAGYENTGGVRANGNLYVWGVNNAGQLGNGTLVDSASPSLVGSGYTAFVPAAFDLSFGLKTDQSLWGWGSDGSYNLGIGGYNQISTPTLIP